MIDARVYNGVGETRPLERLEVRSDANQHDYAILRVPNEDHASSGWQEGDPLRLRWGTSVDAGRSVTSREMVGYVSGHHIEHEEAFAFAEIHVLGATSALQFLPTQDEEWKNRSAISVIREILGRVHIDLHVVGVTEVTRQLIKKPQEQSYWAFLVELAKSTGASLHPVNTTVMLIGNRETLLLPDGVEETITGGSGNFRFSVRSSSRTGRRRKRWVVQYSDLNTGRLKTIDESHLDAAIQRHTSDTLQVATDRTVPDVYEMGDVSYAEALEKLDALTSAGHRYVEADLHLPQPPFAAFSGASLRVQTRSVTTPAGRRLERAQTESGVWRIDKVVHIVDLRGVRTYVMDLDLSRAGLGPQRVHLTDDARPLVASARQFSGRFNRSKGWAA